MTIRQVVQRKEGSLDGYCAESSKEEVGSAFRTSGACSKGHLERRMIHFEEAYRRRIGLVLTDAVHQTPLLVLSNRSSDDRDRACS